jgi:hypothetical protein
MEISYTRVGAVDDRMRPPFNWVLHVAVLLCLFFWVAVVLGIVAVI